MEMLAAWNVMAVVVGHGGGRAVVTHKGGVARAGPFSVPDTQF